MASKALMTVNDLFKAPDPSGIFELVELLGEGSYGSVYKGRHIRTGEIVAVKVVELIDDELEEIKLEVDILRLCKHPNVVNYFGTYLRLDKLWLVMEICQAGSVMDIYKALGRGLKEEHISFITHEALKGLEYMHSQGMIHRDIKAGNILLTQEGEVKLADFGVSALLTADSKRRNTFIGTPYWMAPEVIACDKDETANYDEKCDIWGMAITSIEMAEMDPPLADLHPLRALYLIPSNKPPTLTNAKKWSKNFKDFLKAALVKDPKKRPSATQILKHPFLKGPTHTLRKTKHILSELIEKMVKQEGAEEEEGSKDDDDDDSSEEETPVVEKLKLDNAGVSVRKKTASRKTIVTGTNDIFEVPSMLQQPPTPRPANFKDNEFKDNEDSDRDNSWDLMNSTLGSLADDFGPNKLIANPLFLQKTNSFAVTNAEPTPSSPLPAFKPFPQDQSGAASFLFSSPMAAAMGDDDDYGMKGEAIPEEIVPEVTQTPPASSSSRPIASAETKMPPPPSSKPIDPDDESPNHAPNTETVGRLPFKQTTRRFNTHKEPEHREQTPTTPKPVDNSPRTVKALNLAKNFPFEVLCSASWDDNYLFGTDAGLFQLDKEGNLSQVVPKTKFVALDVLHDYGVLIAICGRHRHIRMYGLDGLIDKQQNKKATGKAKKDPFIKIRETRYCSHYSIVRTKGTVFMVAAIKRQIILFMWADYPFNKFMKIKDFYVPEITSRVEPLLTSDGKISHLCVQASSRFILIDVDTNFPAEIPFPLSKKVVPLLVHRGVDGRIFIAYNKGGHLLHETTLEPTGKFLAWRFVPASVVPLGSDQVLVFGPKMIDIYSLSTGEVVQTIRHKESKKINYLLTQENDVVISARAVKGAKLSNVYIMRSVSINEAGAE